MVNFDASKEWLIIVPSDLAFAEKGVRDLSRHIGLLAAKNGVPKPARIIKAHDSMPAGEAPLIVLNCSWQAPAQNGFEWRAGAERIEIFGESERGLCNGIYSFLSALGISWPTPGQEKLPTPAASANFPLSSDSACEPSQAKGENPAITIWQRFVPAENSKIKTILNEGELFAEWAARNRYDALVFPLATFTSGSARQKLLQLKKSAGEYGIAVEAGGRDLSSLLPRKYFFLHRDLFRMEDGRRKKEHNLCATNPAAIEIIRKEGTKFFKAAWETEVFHLWPDKDAETAWCSCPTCRAFTHQEQYRIVVNAAADALAAINPAAVVTFFEKPGEGGKIHLRENVQTLPNPNLPLSLPHKIHE